MPGDHSKEAAHPFLTDFGQGLWRCSRGHESSVKMIVLGTPVCLPCIVEDYGCKAVKAQEEKAKE